eukprot:TRINITY_DN1559_c1_g1_i1.p1 TRINITY_DN1559_c1_g1~~TRINITY_DN1559_c1_g1_i1.p1  ORF type:complete len:396 (-),score=56.44 TRINITY_DN1559_c1_g1_i1:570-1595(-)
MKSQIVSQTLVTHLPSFSPFAYGKSVTKSAGFRLRSLKNTSKAHRLPRVYVVTSAVAEPPFNVVITGSSKGLGLALAREFLRSGDRVVICSRSEDKVAETALQLTQEFGEDSVAGVACDVREASDVGRLADFAKEKFKHIDIWINNAGSNAYSYGPLVDSDDQHLAEIVGTNTLGVMLCCRQAIRLMREQPRGGHVFNMDGAGADGGATPRFAAYGATKRSLAQLTKSLQAELGMLDIKNVTVHNLSPGMVTTELLMAGATTRQARFFINALAEPADEVASYLVPRVREVATSGRSSSSYIRFLTSPKAYSQILARLLFRARKDRYVVEEEEEEEDKVLLK